MSRKKLVQLIANTRETIRVLRRGALLAERKAYPTPRNQPPRRRRGTAKR